MSHSILYAFVVCWVISVSVSLICIDLVPWPLPLEMLATWLRKNFVCLKSGLKEAQNEITRIQSPSNLKTSHSTFSSSCHVIMLLSSWRWQAVEVSWHKTWEEAVYEYISRLCAAILFVVLVASDHRRWKIMPVFQATRGPFCKNFTVSFIFLSIFYCSTLLEQLSRLQAVLPNSSSKTTHRGTCILVRKQRNISFICTHNIICSN